MRKFTDIQQELGLELFFESQSEHGNLYCAVSATSRAPCLFVRRFSCNLPPALILAYVDLLLEAQDWIEDDSDLANLVQVGQFAEVGCDLSARSHHLGNSLDSFLNIDSEEESPEPPNALVSMQARFFARANAVNSLREALQTSTLAFSLIAPAYKVIYSYREPRHIMVDLRPICAGLERRVELAAE